VTQLNTFLELFDRTITQARAQVFAILLAVSFVCLITALFVQQAMVENGVPPLGRDFAASWSAGHLFWEGRVNEVFNGQVMGGLQSSVSDITGTLYWHYPATFLTVVLPFGWFSYPVGLGLFSVLSFIAWLLVVRKIKPNQTLLQMAPLLFAPAFWMCFAQGQNGTFIAFLLISGLYAQSQGRTVIASLCFAALIVKPHFGVMIPVILIAQSDWKSFSLTAVFCIIGIAISTLIIGAEYWPLFFDNLSLLRAALLTGELTHHQISGFAFAQALGIPNAGRWVLQAIIAVLSILICWVVWRESKSYQLRFATFIITTVLISPYAFHYDAVMCVAALYFLYQHGRLTQYIPGERSLYALFWFAPLILLWSQTASAVFYFFPLLCALLALIVIKIRTELTA
jgi:hypothetical protein